MALIQCPECNQNVSDTAAQCPHCGAPVAVLRGNNSASTPAVTIELTGKKLKAQLLWSSLLWWGGFLWLAFDFWSGDGRSLRTWASIVPLAAGFIWYLSTRIRIWWHHR